MSATLKKLLVSLGISALLGSSTLIATPLPPKNVAKGSFLTPTIPAHKPPTSVSLDLDAVELNWTKACGHDSPSNKDICYVTRDFNRLPTKAPILALAVYSVNGFDMQGMRVFLPLGLSLPSGFQFNVDQGSSGNGSFVNCFASGCFGDVVLSNVELDKLKHGKTLSIVAKNQMGKSIVFNVPLHDLGAAFDGPGINPMILQQQLDDLGRKLQDKKGIKAPTN